MPEKTLIAWTDHTFNPWMGCTKVSSGCKNCYAETLTTNRMGLDVWGKSGRRQITKTPWANVVQWNRSAENDGVIRRVFCASLCDFFEGPDTMHAADVPIIDAARRRVWDIIRRSPNLHFQILTKRADLITRYLPDDWGDGWPNVWLGVSVENMEVAWRTDTLRSIPAAVRFVSYEPALGSLRGMSLDGIDWVIYGGESGPGYRREDKQWARDMRDDCDAAGVAFFHKQSSAYRTEMGIELDGQIIRQYPTVRAT